MLPTNCKKVEIEDVKVNFVLSDAVRKGSLLGQAYIDCYEILSELLESSKLNIRLVEAITHIDKSVKVVLK